MLAKFKARLDQSFAKGHNGKSMWDLIWDETDRWDRDNSNHDDLVVDDDESDCLNRAYELYQAGERKDAFEIWYDRARRGSVWSMLEVARCYEGGSAFPQSFALAGRWYRRAKQGGSQLAALEYARMLARRGDLKGAVESLQFEVDQGWPSAMFWQAWYRYKQSRSAATCKSIRPQLSAASEVGHPGALALLRHFMAKGKLGIHLIPFAAFWGSKATLEMVRRHRTSDPDPSEI